MTQVTSLIECRSCHVWQSQAAFSFRADRQQYRTTCRACLGARPRTPQPVLTSKRCSVCQQLKPATAFYYHAKQQRYRSACRPCAAAQVRHCREANREQYLERERARSARRRAL